MCGIAGFNWEDKYLIREMTETIRHRGPDGHGLYVGDGISLGHRSLSVNHDAVISAQPVTSGDLAIVFDGRVYNKAELTRRFVSEGCAFTQGSDAGVVLNSYRLWGPDCVNGLNGMWAFCIHDRKRKTLFLSRDRFGIKPLCYYFDGVRFIFASELKAIRRCGIDTSVDPAGLNAFFYHRCIARDLTIFRDFHKVQPSENIFFDIAKKKISRKRYYTIGDEIARCRRMPLRERLVSINDLINDAVGKRSVADVPVGCLLSGGLDSSLVAALMSGQAGKLHAFSGALNGRGQKELSFAADIAKRVHARHICYELEIDEAALKHVLENMDEPFGDTALATMYALTKRVRENAKICLSGDGADHVFGGNNIYRAREISRYVPESVRKPPKFVVDSLLPLVSRFFPGAGAGGGGADSILTYLTKRHMSRMEYEKTSGKWTEYWIRREDIRRGLLGIGFLSPGRFTGFNPDNTFLAIQLYDMEMDLAGLILRKVDMASSLNGFEVRIPYLDHTGLSGVIAARSIQIK